jgi:tetratricopeptide (TPR) repeat protein
MVRGVQHVKRPLERSCARFWLAGLASCVALSLPAQVAAAENGAPEAPSELDAAQPGGSTDAKASGADPSARDEAAQRFEAARIQYAQGNYELAAVELERAYALVPDPRVLYKLGKLWLHLQRHAQARRAFEKYLEQSGPDLSPESRAGVETDLERLREKTCELAVNVNVAGSEVFVDDMPFGSSPLSAPLVLDAGEHRVVVRKEGYSTHESRMTLAGNEARRLDAVLEPEVKQPAPAPAALAVQPGRAVPATPMVEPATAAHPTLTWVAWSVTGALAAGAASAGVLGLMAAGELDTLKDDPSVGADALERQADRAEQRLLAADILAGATLLAAGGALYLTLSGQRDSARGTSQAVSFRISPGIVTLGKRF